MNNIEILENKIQCFRHLQNTLDDDEKELFEDGIQQKEIEAIENLIQENKELKNKCNELNFKYTAQWVDDNFIPKSKIKEKIEYYHHKDFIKVQVCYQHDNEARIKEKALRELLEEGE